MTQDDLELEYRRYHSQYDKIETETAPRWLMVTVWSAVLVLCLTVWTGLTLVVLAWWPLGWRIFP